MDCGLNICKCLLKLDLIRSVPLLSLADDHMADEWISYAIEANEYSILIKGKKKKKKKVPICF